MGPQTKPGMTGESQLVGRGTLSRDDKFVLTQVGNALPVDVQYVLSEW